MSVPQIKDRPASALRAMFAGIGSLLSGKSAKDKMRAKPAAEAPADVKAPAPKAAAPETTAEPETTAGPETVAAETTVAPETTSEPEPAAAPEATAGPEKAAEPETAALPLPNYDELTVASLRARLRNLSNDDLVQLKEYEQAHQNRPEVVKMFQNRLIKMTAGMPKLES